MSRAGAKYHERYIVADGEVVGLASMYESESGSGNYCIENWWEDLTHYFDYVDQAGKGAAYERFAHYLEGHFGEHRLIPTGACAGRMLELIRR